MRLTWYIIRLHIGPFLFGTFAVVFIFLLQFVFKFLNDLVGKGLSYGVIAQFVAFNIAWMLVLAVPMGVLVASLMAYGKLAGNNELTIIKSSGGSALSAMLPALIGGGLLFLGLYLFNDRVLPETNHRAFVLQNDIKQLKPALAVDPGRFSSLQGYSILARQVDRANNKLLNVTIYGQEGEFRNVINAKSAELRFNSDLSKLLMTFHDGEIHQLNRRNPGEFRRVSFKRHQIAITTSGFKFNQADPGSISRNDRTMRIDSMSNIADSAEANARRIEARIDSMLAAQFQWTPMIEEGKELTQQEAATIALSEFTQFRSQLESDAMVRNEQIRQADQYRVEIYKKYSIPAACLIFVLVGAPLGIVVRRGNFGVSAAIALGFFVVYWACLVAGEKLADRGVLSPAVAMWMADFVIGVIGIYLTILVTRETITFIRFDWLRRLFRRKEVVS